MTFTKCFTVFLGLFILFIVAILVFNIIGFPSSQHPPSVRVRSIAGAIIAICLLLALSYALRRYLNHRREHRIQKANRTEMQQLDDLLPTTNADDEFVRVYPGPHLARPGFHEPTPTHRLLPSRNADDDFVRIEPVVPQRMRPGYPIIFTRISEDGESYVETGSQLRTEDQGREDSLAEFSTFTSLNPSLNEREHSQEDFVHVTGSVSGQWSSLPSSIESCDDDAPPPYEDSLPAYEDAIYSLRNKLRMSTM